MCPRDKFDPGRKRNYLSFKPPKSQEEWGELITQTWKPTHAQCKHTLQFTPRIRPGAWAKPCTTFCCCIYKLAQWLQWCLDSYWGNRNWGEQMLLPTVLDSFINPNVTPDSEGQRQKVEIMFGLTESTDPLQTDNRQPRAWLAKEQRINWIPALAALDWLHWRAHSYWSSAWINTHQGPGGTSGAVMALSAPIPVPWSRCRPLSREASSTPRHRKAALHPKFQIMLQCS